MKLEKDKEQLFPDFTKYHICGRNGHINGYVAKDKWGVFFYVNDPNSFTIEELESLAKAMKEIELKSWKKAMREIDDTKGG